MGPASPAPFFYTGARINPRRENRHIQPRRTAILLNFRLWKDGGVRWDREVVETTKSKGTLEYEGGRANQKDLFKPAVLRSKTDL